MPDFIGKDLNAKDNIWKPWSQKLLNFVEWRRRTWNEHPKAKQLKKKVDISHLNFIKFCGLQNTKGRVLDIGCGSAEILQYLQCDYVGIDPIIISDISYDFQFIQGVGEYLPFRKEIFDEVIIMQTLDHCLLPDKVIEESISILKPDGAINVEQMVIKDISLKAFFKRKIKEKIKKINKVITIKGVPVDPYDNKLRYFDMDGLHKFFSKYFREVKIQLANGGSQLYLRAESKK